MRRLKEKNLYRYLKDYELTSRAADRFEDSLNFEVDLQMPQRKLVDLGRMLGRIITMDLTARLGDRGFRSDLVSNCLAILQQEAESILSTYRGSSMPSVVEDYVQDSAWLDFVQPNRA
jgi:hypothetical protein